MIVMECWWRIFDILDYKETLRLAALLECRLLIPANSPRFDTDAEGYHRLHLFIVSECEVFLLTFANTANLYHHLDIQACQRVGSVPEQHLITENFILLLVEMISRHNHEVKYGVPVMKHEDEIVFDDDHPP